MFFSTKFGFFGIMLLSKFSALLALTKIILCIYRLTICV